MFRQSNNFARVNFTTTRAAGGYSEWGLQIQHGLATRIGIEMAIAAVFNKVEEFNSDREKWTQYVERFEHFFEDNGIEEADKKKEPYFFQW